MKASTIANRRSACIVVDIRKMPGPIKTFWDIVESDLRRAARLIIRVQDEIDPQFRMATPDGGFHLAVTLPPEPVYAPEQYCASETAARCRRAGVKSDHW